MGTQALLFDPEFQPLLRLVYPRRQRPEDRTPFFWDIYPNAFRCALRRRWKRCRAHVRLTLADACKTTAPSEADLVSAVMDGARGVVALKWIGRYPQGYTFEDMVNEIATGALARARKWRSGGPKSLKDFCFMSCKYAMLEFARNTQKRAEDPDVLDSGACVSFEDAGIE
jgi:hypothetical protein